MAGVRLRLPHWTAHPAFGVAVLLALAIVLILHGEPQPSSRPSGTSVVVSSKTPADVVLPSTLVISEGSLSRRQGSQAMRVALPAGEDPVSVTTSGTLAVALAVQDGHQRAYAISATLKVTDLGYADAVVASSYPGAAVVVERASVDPGLVVPSTPVDSATTGTSGATSPAGTSSAATSPAAASAAGASAAGASAAGASAAGAVSATSSSSAVASATVSSSSSVTPVAREFTARRYDPAGRQLGQSLDLLPGARIAADTADGLLIWQPVGAVTQRGRRTQSLAATASLIRPDGSVRVIGAVHPLAATGTELLVWDVGRSEFGLMPLSLVTATTTRTASPTSSGSAAEDSSSSATPDISGSATVSASPSTVAGARWFQPTRGFVVTGPATFSPDGQSFAAYGQVGNRRRLIIGRVADVGTDRIEVLALSRPAASSSSSSSGSSASGSAEVSVSGTVSPPSRLTPVASSPTTTLSARSKSGPATSESPRPPSLGQPSSEQPASQDPSGQSSAGGTRPPSKPAPTTLPTGFEQEGFPIAAPASPVWLDTLVVALAPDGTVIGYVPGHSVASVLDFGTAAVTSLAAAP